MKQNKIIIAISMLTISLLIGLGLQIKTQESIGNLKVNIDPNQKSVIIIKQQKEVFKKDDCSSMCKLYFATTYQVKYSGYDGDITPNETLITLNQANANGIPVFKLPSNKNNVIGVVLGSAGGSGGGSQTLYLIDIVTGKSCFVSVADMREPIWFTNSKHFGYIEKTYRYVGSRMRSIGMDVVLEAFVFNPGEFNFKVDSLASNKAYQSELLKVSLSTKELDLLKDKTMNDLYDLYYPESGVYHDILQRLVAEIYYRTQLKQYDFIHKEIAPYLDDSVFEEMKYLMD